MSDNDAMNDLLTHLMNYDEAIEAEADDRTVGRLRDDVLDAVRALAAETRAEASAREVERLREALLEIRNDEGRVCDVYELCDHVACASSYAAWVIADMALSAGTPEAREGDDE